MRQANSNSPRLVNFQTISPFPCGRTRFPFGWSCYTAGFFFTIFGDRRQDKFVILLAIVAQNETDLFPPPHLNARGLVTHLPASLEHLDVDDAGGLFWITRLAG